jgi:hypothetical protein
MKNKILIIFLALSIKTFACSCIYEFSEFTPVYLYEYNRIFICKAFSVDTVDNKLIYRAIVLKTYWGTKSDTVNISTFFQGGMCGLPLELYKPYLIYGNGSSSIEINHCGPSRKLSGKQLNKENGWEINSKDSVRIPINGVFEKHTVKYINRYFEKTCKLELKYLKEISNLVSGRLITKFTNDTISGVLNFKNGKLDSVSVFYFSNGRQKEKGSFTENLKEGIWTESIFKTIRGKSYHLVWTGLNKKNIRRGKWKGEMQLGSYEELNSYVRYNLDNDYE